MRRARPGWLFGAALFALFVPRLIPWLLVFPFHTQAGAYEVWSESPIDGPRLGGIVAQATKRLAASPIYASPERRNLYLTHGGWRWKWLTLSLNDAFAISPPIGNAIIVNSNSITDDGVWNGRPIGGHRSLTGIIAHETCHGMERARFGLASDWSTPTWMREGYCDYVAQESSLTDADVAKLTADHRDHPALPYYYGRRRVAAILAGNGGSVDKLFNGGK